MCEVCGKTCGPLVGRAKSWRCAGLLSHQSKKLNDSQLHWEAERVKYDNAGKRKARAVPMRILERLPSSARYLELSGGGRSAEQARQMRPDVEIVSADTNGKLWPALLDHAARYSYTPLTGSFLGADGLFDLIYLDLTGNSSDSTSMMFVRRATSMLTKNGYLVVTITPDHEGDSAVSLNRPVTVVSLLAGETERQPVGVLVYSNGGGKRVTLCVLRGPFRRLDLVSLKKAIASRALYSYWAFQGHTFMMGGNSTLIRATPEGRAKHNAKSRAYKQRPDVAEAVRAQAKVKKSTPEWKAHAAAYQRARRLLKGDEYRARDRKRYHDSPARQEWLASYRKARYVFTGEEQRAHQNTRYANDEAYREQVKAKERYRYHVRKLLSEKAA